MVDKSVRQLIKIQITILDLKVFLSDFNQDRRYDHDGTEKKKDRF